MDKTQLGNHIDKIAESWKGMQTTFLRRKGLKSREI